MLWVEKDYKEIEFDTVELKLVNVTINLFSHTVSNIKAQVCVTFSKT